MNDKNNKEELEKIKLKYIKLIRKIKIIIYILIILLLLYISKTAYVYIRLSKIIDANKFSNIGDNFKITYTKTYPEGYTDTNTIYLKDNIIKNSESGFDTYCIGNTNYIIIPDENKYNKHTIYASFYELIGNSLTFQYFSCIKASSLIDYIVKYNIKFSEENYNGTNCITMESPFYKMWVDKETYLVKKEESLTNGITVEFNIEKDTVMIEDVTLPDLSGYTEYN